MNLDNTGKSETAMGEALHKAGVKTPRDEAMDMLDRHWQRHGPHMANTLTAFADELRGRYPIMVAIIGEVALLDRVRSFAFGDSKTPGHGHPGLVQELRRHNGMKAAESRVARAGYSKNPATAAARQRRWAKTTAASRAAINDSLPEWPYFHGATRESVKNFGLEKRVRAREGIVRVKLEIDPRKQTMSLVGSLPAALRSIKINGLQVQDVTKEAALKWCETHRKQTALVELWCSLVADPRKTLGEQLTAEIVAALAQREAA